MSITVIDMSFFYRAALCDRKESSAYIGEPQSKATGWMPPGQLLVEVGG